MTDNSTKDYLPSSHSFGCGRAVYRPGGFWLQCIDAEQLIQSGVHDDGRTGDNYASAGDLD